MSNLSRRHFLQFTSSMFATIGLSQLKFLQEENYGKVLAQSIPVYDSGDPNQPQIALTFDDGPSNVTSRLLEVLNNHNAKATFFCLGQQVEKFPGIVREIMTKGHLIANHSYSHAFLRNIDKNKVREELQKTNEAIKKAIPGYTINYFRPPYGQPPYPCTDPNWTACPDPDNENKVAQVLKELGLTHIHWSIDTKDYEKNKDCIVQTLMKAKNGSIILCHDTSDKTVEAIGQAIPLLKNQGLSFVTIDQMSLRSSGHNVVEPSCL
jgi:peptidoglycan-N-acetylglucosamine deacetylase